MEEVKLRKRRKRIEGKEAFDNSKCIQTSQIRVKDVVLKHDAKKEIDRSTIRKLLYKWLRLYQVRTANVEKGTYKLEEFDGTPLPGTHSGNRLKKFVKREGFYKPVENEEKSDSKDKEEIKEREAKAKKEAKVKPKEFEIKVPTLTPAQRSKYIQYKEDDKGNIL